MDVLHAPAMAIRCLRQYSRDIRLANFCVNVIDYSQISEAAHVSLVDKPFDEFTLGIKWMSVPSAMRET